MINFLNILFPLIFLLIPARQEYANSNNSNRVSVEKQWNEALKRLDKAFDKAYDSTQYPRSLEPSGKVRGVPSKDWTSGFFPGNLWLAYQHTGEDKYKTLAEKWTASIEKEKWNDYTHDIGFKVFCSFGEGYKMTHNPHYKEVILQSARTLSTRFNKTVGCIRSWSFGDWQFPVIIDNMMNLELLFFATQLSGDSSFYNIAKTHALTTLKNHYRPDHSTYHLVNYDPETGEVISKETHQGYNAKSDWARGQAWGLYGFTMAYRYTHDARFLDQAKKIAAFLLNHPAMPNDYIPYWDLKAPGIPNEPKDASAAAIIASALYELSHYTKDEKYLDIANRILNTLSSKKYMVEKSATHPFILKHSVGNMPKKDEVDVPIIYADFYYLEALTRKYNLSTEQH